MGRHRKFVPLSALQLGEGNQSNRNDTTTAPSSNSTVFPAPITIPPQPDSVSDDTTSTETFVLGQLVPLPLRESRNLVCIDVECHCHNQSFREYRARGNFHTTTRRICEVGIATVNTAALSTYTTHNGEALKDGHRYAHLWREGSECIQGVNIGIQEHRHDPSRARCHWPGCKVGVVEDFDFGPVLWCRKAEAVKTIIEAIKSRTNPAHPISFLFFDKSNDIKWLEELGLDFNKVFPGHGIIDIQRSSLSCDIARCKRKPKISASDYMHALGIEVVRAHNGGNDAVYELRGMLAELTLSKEQRDEIIYGAGCLPYLDRFGQPIRSWSDLQDEDGVKSELEGLALDSLSDFPTLGS